jgi:tetratricopeptide (TPR) repeat protein
VSLHELGRIRHELGQKDCVLAYEESLMLDERIGDRSEACAFNLGRAFMELPTLRDLDQAESWYLRSLALRDERDRLGRGRCLHQLGMVAQGRFRKAKAAGRPTKEILLHFTKAVRLYQEALELIPLDAVNDLATTHGQLGVVYREAADLDHSVLHCREAIQLFEQAEDPFRAALARGNMATSLLLAGRRKDALEYAEAALRGFESYGERAVEMIEETRGLIAKICGA